MHHHVTYYVYTVSFLDNAIIYMYAYYNISNFIFSPILT